MRCVDLMYLRPHSSRNPMSRNRRAFMTAEIPSTLGAGAPEEADMKNECKDYLVYFFNHFLVQVMASYINTVNLQQCACMFIPGVVTVCSVFSDGPDCPDNPVWAFSRASTCSSFRARFWSSVTMAALSGPRATS